MTRKAPFTQAAVRRNIEAARKAGLQVEAIRADGTLLLKVEDIPLWIDADRDHIRPTAETNRWADEG